MVETKWQVNPITGKGFNQTANQLNFFQQEFQEQDQRKQLDYLKDRILETLNSKTTGLSNKDVYLLTLQNDFKPSHANAVLKSLINNNQIEVFNIINERVSVDFGLGISYRDYKEKKLKVVFKKKNNYGNNN